jgi:MFS family permease
VVSTGRVLAVPLALCWTTSWSLLVQLVVCLTGCVFFMAWGYSSMWALVGASVVYGLGMSSIFPLVMSLPGELGFLLDLRVTSKFLIGSCSGEALLPLAVGLLMQDFGPELLGYCIFAGTILMFVGLAYVQITLRPALAGLVDEETSGTVELVILDQIRDPATWEPGTSLSLAERNEQL